MVQKGLCFLGILFLPLLGLGVERVAERIGRAVFLLFNIVATQMVVQQKVVGGAIFCLKQVDTLLELGFGLGSPYVACANFVLELCHSTGHGMV